MNSQVDLPSAAVQEYWSTKAAPRVSLLDRLSPQGCSQELTAARHAIDDELSALHMIMCAMRTRRNNFSLIGRLPPEILSYIFSFHATNQPIPRDPSIYCPDDPSPSTSSRIQLGLGWITVTHVCRRWRQAALSDPNLWRTVLFDLGVEWAEEMLARSKAALISYNRDLSFRPRVSSRRSLDDEVTLRKHFSRVQQLVLYGDVDSLTPVMRALITPAPYLESLEVRRSGAFRERYITLPSDLFAHDAPKLRHVTLFDCAVPWDSPLFRELTHLDIRVPPSTKSDLLSIPTLERLLCVLEAMPSLQVLTLGKCLPRGGSTSRVVPLRHMSKLSLDGSLPEIVAVLERVSLPSSASLSLQSPVDGSPDGHLDTLLSLLASHFQAPETPLSTISIDEVNYRSLQIMVWDVPVPLHQSHFKPSAPARLHLTLTDGFPQFNERLSFQICKALPLRDLQTLSLTYPEVIWPTADWMDMYINCPEVTHLRIRRGWAITLIPMLVERNVFPSLVTLALWDIEFFGSLSPDQNHKKLLGSLSSEEMHKEFLGNGLLVILRARSDAGIPVRRVSLTSCVLTRRWLASLKRAVNDVVLDPDQGHNSGYCRPSTVYTDQEDL